MHDTLFRAVTVALDFWQNLAIAALIFTTLRLGRRIAAVERQLHRERAGTTVINVHQPPPANESSVCREFMKRSRAQGFRV